MCSPNTDEAFLTQGQHEEETVVREPIPVVVCFVDRPQKYLVWNR